jgi:transcriptional/translational regulatory protein YebC/TACO1
MLSKIIQIAAKKGADPKMNPSLELALQKARYMSVPRDIIDRAILKGSGQLEGENMEEIFFEGYGPGGVAILVKTLTSNTNRTASSMKTIMGKH